MNDLIKKADRAALNIVTAVVRWWVRKRDYKKHKYDLLINVEWCMLGFLIAWAVVIPTVLYVVSGDMATAVLHALLWSFLVAMEWFSVQTTIYKIKPLHDYLFSMRKNPEFAKMHGEMLEELFEEGRQKRLETTGFLVSITVAIVTVLWFVDPSQAGHFVLEYLMINLAVSIIKRYVVYVNDFEEPPKKKKASEAITELLARLWGELTGGFMPQPAFGM